MKKLIILTFLLTGSCTLVFAQKPGVVISDKEGWHKIGETIVNFKTDTDAVLVMGADRFAFVKIKITDAPVHLMSFEIQFENGEKQAVTIGKEIKAPGETHVVQLNGGERRIKKVTFAYKTAANTRDKKAHVELWGMKTNTDKKTTKK